MFARKYFALLPCTKKDTLGTGTYYNIIGDVSAWTFTVGPARRFRYRIFCLRASYPEQTTFAIPREMSAAVGIRAVRYHGPQ